MLQDRPTLVVSPLVARQRDQRIVERTRDEGAPEAVVINSMQRAAETRGTTRGAP